MPPSGRGLWSRPSAPALTASWWSRRASGRRSSRRARQGRAGGGGRWQGRCGQSLCGAWARPRCLCPPRPSLLLSFLCCSKDRRALAHYRHLLCCCRATATRCVQVGATPLAFCPSPARCAAHSAAHFALHCAAHYSLCCCRHRCRCSALTPALLPLLLVPALLALLRRPPLPPPPPPDLCCCSC